MSELTKEDEYGIISRTMMNIRSLRVFAREVDFEQLLEILMIILMFRFSAWGVQTLW